MQFQIHTVRAVDRRPRRHDALRSIQVVAKPTSTQLQMSVADATTLLVDELLDAWLRLGGHQRSTQSRSNTAVVRAPEPKPARKDVAVCGC